MPTFPVEDMSQVHLEHAATGPDRWLRGMANASLQGEKKLSPFTITPLKLGEDVYSASIRELHLIPGGRYLITSRLDLVEVWDLGIPWSPSGIPPTARKIGEASVSIEYDLTVHGTSDGKGLLILLCSESNAKITLYVIYPADEQPKLLKYAELPASTIDDSDLTLLTTWSMLDNRMAFLLGPTLSIWDYKAGTWASISIEEDYLEIIVTKSAIAVLYHPRILIWAMPTLSNTKPFSPILNATFIPPTITISIPVDISKFVSNFEVPPFWYGGSTQPLIFDIVYDPDSTHRYELVINEDITNATISPLVEIPDPGDRFYEGAKFCNDALVTLWNAEHGLEAQAASTSDGNTDSSGPGPGNCILLLQAGELNNEELDIVPDFCPCSGRLVYIGRNRKIDIMQFHLG